MNFIAFALRPGVRLMGKTRMTVKLSLFGLMMASLLLLLLAFIVQDARRDIGAARSQRAGLRVALGIADVIAELQVQRGLTHRALSGDTQAQSEIGSALTRLREAVTSLDERVASTTEFELSDIWTAQRARVLAPVSASGNGSAAEAFAAHSARIEGLRQLMLLTAERAGLLAVPQGASFFLTDLTLQRVPPWTEELAAVRGLSAGLLSRRDASTTERAHLIWRAEALQRQLDAVRIGLDSVVRAGEPVPPTWESARAATQRFAATVRQAIESDHTSEQPQTIFAAGTEAISAARNFNRDVTASLVELIGEREAHKTRTLAAQLMAAVAALLVMAYLALSFRFSMSESLQALSNITAAVAAGDLSQRARLGGGDELAVIAGQVETMSDRLSSMVAEIRSSAVRVGQAGQSIADSGRSLAFRTERQSESLQQSVSTVKRLNASAASNASAALSLDQLTAGLRERAEAGGLAMRETVASIASLQSGTQRVAEINGVIDDIAFQTNLLALNAAVEAARAGESGKGFAVVAAEVRELARRCTEAAAEVRSLIEQTTDQVGVSSARIGEVDVALASVVSGVSEVSDRLRSIAAASAEQSDGLGELTQSVDGLNEITRENAVAVQASAAASLTLVEQARALRESVASMQLRQGSADEARGLVEAAQRHIAQTGWAIAVKAFNDPHGAFVDRDMYLFALDRSGRYHVYGARPEFVGRVIHELPNVSAKQADDFLREAWSAAEQGQGWIEYDGSDLDSGETRSKTAFILAVDDDVFIGCGIYRMDRVPAAQGADDRPGVAPQPPSFGTPLAA